MSDSKEPSAPADAPADVPAVPPAVPPAVALAVPPAVPPAVAPAVALAVPRVSPVVALALADGFTAILNNFDALAVLSNDVCRNSQEIDLLILTAPEEPMLVLLPQLMQHLDSMAMQIRAIFTALDRIHAVQEQTKDVLRQL